MTRAVILLFIAIFSPPAQNEELIYERKSVNDGKM